MPIPILTDREKIYKWNDICMQLGWSHAGEVEIWLRSNNVRFTPGQSVLAPEGIVLRVASPDAARGLVVGPSGEIMATHVLSVYIGMITFQRTSLESIFWHEVIERMSNEFATFIPPDLIPAYIREILKYPADGDGSIEA